LIRRRLFIHNRLGLHARAAARFVHTASAFRAKITVSRSEKTMEGKSILGLLLLAAAQGAEIEIMADGDDEGAAIEALSALVEGGFGEEG
jgi:phosphotransferase system HPr (HPr) family protein